MKELEDELPRAENKKDALDIALSAAELSMRALSLTQDPIAKESMSAKLRTLLGNAERIKHSPGWRPASSLSVASPSSPKQAGHDVGTIKKLREPVSGRKLSKKEEILVLKASFLNGFKFPPWKGPPSDAEFELGPDGSLFSDTPELQLSALQLEVFDGWKRPSQALPPPAWFPDGSADLGPSMTTDRKIDLVQDAATDCSVVASLCAGTARGQKGHARILSSVLFPYDQNLGHPVLSHNGRYIVRLNFNGAYRRVDIDDRLPVSKTARTLHVIDRHTPGLLWPALLEKAYLKVRGSYDFPGSNSGTDLWILCGWIPEQIFLQSNETAPNIIWKRIMNAHEYGDVLVTMGTGKISDRIERETGLAGEHDYAVLDLRELGDQKLMLVKNPWIEGMSFKGHIPTIMELTPQNDSADHTSTYVMAPGIEQPDDQQLPLSPGTFWMDLNNVLQHFESIYLNWNPGLFSHRQDIHFPWDLIESTDDTTHRGKYRSFTNNPQFQITVQKSSVAWVLLCRHFRNCPSQRDQDNRPGTLPGYISLYAFDASGSKIYLSDNPILRGPFVDSPQTLLRLDNLVPRRAYTIVAAEHDLPQALHTFTLSVFATSPIVLDEAVSKYPYQRTIASSWSSNTAGGNGGSPNYLDNPQFALTINARTPIALLLETPAEDLNVHVKLVHGRGQRVEAIRSRDIIFDSKDYKRGCALAQCPDLEAGSYTIICSAFDAGRTGPFTLRVDSAVPAQIRALPRDGAGRFRLLLPPVLFENQQLASAASIMPNRLTKLKIIVKDIAQKGMSHSEKSMVLITLQSGRGPERRILIASGNGEYGNAVTGVRTQEIDVSPHTVTRTSLWLVVQRMYTPRDLLTEVLQVEISTDIPGAVEVGEWRHWDD